jgi:hypothetical protein
MWIKRGQLVEYSKEYHRNWPPEDESKQLFGVCLEDTNNLHQVKVITKDNKQEVAEHIYAFGWAGWMPDYLEEIHHKIYTEDHSNISEDFEDEY